MSRQEFNYWFELVYNGDFSEEDYNNAVNELGNLEVLENELNERRRFDSNWEEAWNNLYPY